MKKLSISLFSIFLVACSTPASPLPINNINMQITSSAFQHNGSMPSQYTCDGKSINPPLIFSNIPKEAKSLTMIMEDPDVPKHIRPDSMWNHWIVWNMPITTGIPEDSIPDGVVGKNTSEFYGYAGACPPDREHRYFFKLYALDTMLNLDPTATKEDLLQAMEGHILDSAELIGRYERS